jgi:hypothetical protein
VADTARRCMRAVTEEGSDMGGATLQREMECGAILRPEAGHGREDSRTWRGGKMSAKKDFGRLVGNTACWFRAILLRVAPARYRREESELFLSSLRVLDWNRVARLAS